MKEDQLKSSFECVEPRIGARLWELEGTELDPSSRSFLEAHVTVCDACREALQLDGQIREMAREGRLRAPRRDLRRRPAQVVPIAAALAVAASLLTVFLVPPRPTAETGALRGLAVPRFIRPVEGEVVAARQPVLRWTSIDGVTRYLVEIRDREGQTVWSGESEVPEIRVDPSAGLGSGREYRALLSVRPADLAPPVPASVVFRSDSWGPVLLHRARWAPLWLQAATVLSLGFLLVTSLGRRRHPGAEAA